MKLEIVTIVWFVTCILDAILAEETTTMYTTKYDNIDIDAVIKNERLVNRYVGCLLGENKCTPDARELKKKLPDALATGCGACSYAQKSAADKFYHHLIDNQLELWKKLEEQYDRNGQYRMRYLDAKSKELHDKEVDEKLANLTTPAL